MGVKLDSVKVDLSLEGAGSWEDSASYPGVSYWVRGIRYQPFETARDLAMQALAKQYRTQPVPRAESAAALGGAVADHLLLGWNGFDEAYEADSARQRLTDPAFRNLLDDVLRASARVGEQDLEFTEALVKNSVPPSAIS